MFRIADCWGPLPCAPVAGKMTKAWSGRRTKRSCVIRPKFRTAVYEQQPSIDLNAPEYLDTRRRLSQLGYANVSDYVADHPTEPYVGDLADRLNMIPVLLPVLQFAEAEALEDLRKTSRDSLFREIVGNSHKQDWIAFSLWSVHMTGDAVTELADRIYRISGMTQAEVESVCDRIMSHIRESAPSGWVPESADDPILVQAFDEVWPT